MTDEPTTPDPLCALLREIRHERHMSLLEVEQATGHRWSAAALSSYERGYRTPNIRQLRGLLAIYGWGLTAVPPECILILPDGTEMPCGSPYEARHLSAYLPGSHLRYETPAATPVAVA